MYNEFVIRVTTINQSAIRTDGSWSSSFRNNRVRYRRICPC